MKGGNHWALTVIDLDRRRVSHYDSLGSSPTHEGPSSARLVRTLRVALSKVREGLAPEAWAPNDRTIRILGAFDDESWRITAPPPAEQPSQCDLLSCGVFAVATASRLARGLPLDYNQSHVPYYRCAIAAALARLQPSLLALSE
jgi:Ulp1 family protease